MNKEIKKWFSLNLGNKKQSNCGCSDSKCDDQSMVKNKDGVAQVFDVNMDRRQAFKKLTAGLMIGAGAVSTSCSVVSGEKSKEKSEIEWEEYFKGNYKLMTDEEKNNLDDTVGAGGGYRSCCAARHLGCGSGASGRREAGEG